MHDNPSSRSNHDQEQLRRHAQVLRVWALVVLVPVAVIGAVLSFQSLYQAAVPVFGTRLALGFPLLVDFLILGASLQYVAGAKTGRPRAGWRWTAHAGVAGTLALNAMAARTVRDVPWHVTAPAVWSVLVELTAREFLGQWRAVHAPPGDRISLRLWLTAPLESGRTWLRLARRVKGEQAAARLDVGVHAAAVEALKLALPQRRARRVRRILRRQLRAGSLPPAAILGPLGWMNADDALTDVTPEAVLRAALRDTLQGPPALTRPLDSTGETTRLQQAPVPSTPEPAPTLEPPVSPAAARGSDTPDPSGPGAAAEPAAEPAAQPAPPTTVTPSHGSHQTIDLTDPADPHLEDERPNPAATTPLSMPQTIGDRPGAASTGDRFADAIDVVRVHESISAGQLATQLRGLGWHLSDRTASRILAEVREHLMQLDPWALPTP